MTSFVIKIIACITMVLDHVKYAIPQLNNFITIYWGRTSYTLFAFLLVEGYVHTSDLKKYYKRLIICGIISQIPFMLFRYLVGEWKLLNIMFTLFLGLISINVYDKIDKKYISIPICILLVILGELLHVDYGFYGVAVIIVLYIFRNNKILKVLSYGLVVLLYFYFLKLDFFQIFTIKYYIAYMFPMVFIMLYNGEEGKKLKYFFYAFYPIHMLVIYGLSFIF